MDLLACAGLDLGEWVKGSRRSIRFSIAAAGIVGLISPQRGALDMLLDQLTGFRTPLHGTISLAGQRIDGLSPAAVSRAGLVRTMSTASLPPDALIEDYLTLALRFRHLPAAPDYRQALRPLSPAQSGRIEIMLEFVGLAASPAEPVGTLMPEQRSRLELARVLLQQPKIIVVDQLFAGLSGSGRTEVSEILASTQRSGTALLVADHDTLTLSRLCQRVLVLHEGNLIADGSPDEVGASEQVQLAFTGVEAA